MLGRPPLHQQEIGIAAEVQAEKGFNGLIDFIVDSTEYTEVFGDHTIPYVRSFASASGMAMLNFVRIAALEQNFSSSDQSKGSDSLLRSSLASGASIAFHVAPAPEFVKVSMT